jgi:uncharacterized membrane protein YqhA
MGNDMNRLIEKFKYISYIGIFSLLLASVASFGWGGIKTIKVIQLILSTGGQNDYIAIALIELVDSFLIATALFIFSVSMYEMFIDKLPLPEWMLSHNLHELKSKLGGVIILVMVVKFLEHLVNWENAIDTLFFAISITAVSAALIALNRFGGDE